MTCLPGLQEFAVILVLSGCQPPYLNPFQKTVVLFFNPSVGFSCGLYCSLEIKYPFMLRLFFSNTRVVAVKDSASQFQCRSPFRRI